MTLTSAATRATGPSHALPPDRPRRFRSLASRLVAVGLLQFVLLAVTAVGIFYAEGPHDDARPEDHLAPHVVHHLAAVLDEPEALRHALAHLKSKRIEVSLYDGQRQLIASNVEPPLAIPPRRRHGMGPPPPPPPPPTAGSGHDGPPPGPGGFGPPPPDEGGPPAVLLGPRALVMGFPVRGDRGFLVARGVHGEPPGLTGPLLALICGFAILVLGALLTARWIVRPIDRLSRTARALGTGDLSARSRLDRADEIGELGNRLDEMAERISTLLVTEKELLANVAHELRTPLTRIGVALDLASEGDAEAARASLAEIAVDITELESIVDDILVAMRFEIAGGASLPLRKSITAPGDIARAAAERFRARHPERPLDVTIADELPALDVDRMLVRRVLDNLLENAHKYTPDRAATIELTVRRADPATSTEDLVFEVRDRGIGITADDLPRVFTAFFRGDRSRSRETGGVGLGLTLAKRIVEAHGGRIEVASKPGDGTTVRVTLKQVDTSKKDR